MCKYTSLYVLTPVCIHVCMCVYVGARRGVGRKK